jgi:NTP pyrophosphatase (non-canonical NTP hydrolase)
MNETQESIGRWARDTFPGGDDLSPRHCLRLLEEVVELCLAAGAMPFEIDQCVVDELNKYMDWSRTHPEPEKVAEEMADCEIVLQVLAERRSVNLQAEVDRKMKINRARTWDVREDGTGYHKKTEPA